MACEMVFPANQSREEAVAVPGDGGQCGDEDATDLQLIPPSRKDLGDGDGRHDPIERRLGREATRCVGSVNGDIPRLRQLQMAPSQCGDSRLNIHGVDPALGTHEVAK